MHPVALILLLEYIVAASASQPWFFSYTTNKERPYAAHTMKPWDLYTSVAKMATHFLSESFFNQLVRYMQLLLDKFHSFNLLM